MHAEHERQGAVGPEGRAVAGRQLLYGAARIALVSLLVVLATVLLMLLADDSVARWSATVAKTPSIERFRAFVHPLGREPIQFAFVLFLLVTALATRTRQYARLAALVFLTWALGGGMCHLIKIVAHRPRPEVMSLPWQGDWGPQAMLLENAIKSFPSGDVTIAAGLATVVFLAIGRGVLRYLFLLIPLLVALGRISGAKHYPSDCLFGWFLGTLAAIAVWKWLMPKGFAVDQPTSAKVTTSS